VKAGDLVRHVVSREWGSKQGIIVEIVSFGAEDWSAVATVMREDGEIRCSSVEELEVISEAS
jgi:hypothetical protein